MGTGIHRIAKKALLRQPLRFYAIMLFHVLLRILAFSPFWLPLVFKRARFLSAPGKVFLVLFFYLLIIFPARFRTALRITRSVRFADSSRLRLSGYPALVAAGFLRLARGIIWGFPLLFLLYEIYRYIFVLDGSRFMRDLTAFGGYFTASTDTLRMQTAGIAAVFTLVFAAALLTAYGWWRDVPFDFQMVGKTAPLRALRSAKKARRRCLSQLRRNALLHALLFFAALIVFLVLLYFRIYSVLGSSPLQGLDVVILLASSGFFSWKVFLLPAAAFFLLYFPFLPYRKIRNGAVVVNCYAKER